MESLTQSEIQLIQIIKKYQKNVRVFLDGNSSDEDRLSAQRELEELQDGVIVIKCRQVAGK